MDDRVEPPIFIMGCMRSGTSLVSSVLDSHSRVAIFYESYLYNYFHSDLRFYGDLNKPANLRWLIVNVCEAITVQKIMPPRPEELEEALAARTFPAVFAAVLHLYTRSQGKERAGDKTPDHHFHLKDIQRDFPESPVVFVMRDPRDTVLSLRKAFGVTVEAGARAWNEAFASYSAARDTVHPLRYEELAYAPQQTIESLCVAIGETFEPTMLRFFERAPRHWQQVEIHKKLTHSIDTSSVGTFRQMPPEKIERIEAMCAEGMETLGYAFTSGRKTGRSVSAAGSKWLRRVTDRLRYYGFHADRWKEGLPRWKQLARLRLRYWLLLGPVRSGY